MNEDSNHQKVLKLQKRIFLSLKAEARLLLGEMPESIRRYERENRRDLYPRSITPIPKQELIDAVRDTDVTFIADFHSFDQAQRTALRIMREAIRPDETWYIGLELIPSQFQSALDQFQAGKISLEEFHSIVSYQEEWGFPWSNYSPIFEWARERQIRLIALNRPRKLFYPREDFELEERDQWAAGIITDIFAYHLQKKKPRPKMIVLYGELHVGTQHLPKQLRIVSRSFLKRALKWVTIHQNEDRLFWRLARRDQELHTEVIRIKPRVYCVFSSTPWAKLQSLVSWAEGLPQDAWEVEPDYLSIIRTYCDTLSEFLGVPPPSYEGVSACTMNQLGFLDHLQSLDSFSAEERRLIRFHIQTNQRIYIPRVGVAYLGSPSPNGAAELAAIHLLRTKTRFQGIFQRKRDEFYRLILENAFGFFGSLVINPRRKCDLPKDHLKRLESLEKNERPAFRYEEEARKIALGILRNRAYPGLEIETVLKTRKLAPAVMMAARYVGKVIGKNLHRAILEDQIPLHQVQKIFLKSSSVEGRSENHYQSLISEILEGPQFQGPSKLDHL